MNLKPWQKISIAISSIWILGMGAYLYSGFSSVSIGAGQTIYRVCVAEQQSLNGAELNYCNKEQGEVQQALMARQWGAEIFLKVFKNSIFHRKSINESAY